MISNVLIKSFCSQNLDASTLTHEFILREISQTLSQRKKLHNQVSKLENELNSLECTSDDNGKSSQNNGQRNDKSPGRHKSRHRSRNQEWPSIPDVGKIEEKNPEILALKILETGRQIEAGRIPLLPQGTELRLENRQTTTPESHPLSRAGIEIKPEPRVQVKQEQSRMLVVSPRFPPTSGHGSHLVSKENVQHFDPKMHPSNIPRIQPEKAPKSFSMVRAQEPPRVADIESRLKLIITNVLNEDKLTGHSKPQHPLPPTTVVPPSYASPGCRAESKQVRDFRREARDSRAGQPDYTQVSPAKLALRRHLSQEKLAMESHPGIISKQQTYARNVGDLISGEIERSLEMTSHSPHNSAVDMTCKSVSPRSNSRISRIVEESFGKHPSIPEVSDGRQRASPALRVVYSPISRPNSTDSLPPAPHTPQAMEGLMYPRVKSPRMVSQEEKPRMPPPVPSPGHDVRENQSSSAYCTKRPSLPSTPPRPRETHPPDPNSSRTLARPCRTRTDVSDVPALGEGPPPMDGMVEGLAASLHARFSYRTQLHPQVSLT